MISLVRHGQTPYNAERRLQGQRDIPLSPLGIEQAENLGRRLKDEGARFDALYCSRLQRARVTAEIVGRYLGMTPEILPGVEEINFGCFEGHTFEECEKLFPEEYAEFMIRGSDSRPHGGETGRMVLERAVKALLSIPEAKDGKVLVVCHGAVIGFLRAFAAGAPLKNVSEFIPDNAELVAFGKAEMDRLIRNAEFGMRN